MMAMMLDVFSLKANQIYEIPLFTFFVVPKLP